MKKHIKTIEIVKSKIDNVTKYIVEDEKFGKNEVSIIYKKDKVIFCVPTQTNCKIGCTFCHLTGTTRKAINLTVDWLDSVIDHLIESENLHNISKDILISFMGVGEPFLNVDFLIKSIEKLTNKHQNIRFGISTMMPNISSIRSLTEFLLENGHCRVKLHLSVHGIFNRDKIVNSKVDISEAISAIQKYHKITKQPIEYHYTLVNEVNDSVKELNAFNNMISDDGSTVKFLTLSETNGCTSTNLSEKQIRSLFPDNIVEFYDPPGRDIGSSCGMFNKELYNT